MAAAAAAASWQWRRFAFPPGDFFFILFFFSSIFYLAGGGFRFEKKIYQLNPIAIISNLSIFFKLNFPAIIPCDLVNCQRIVWRLLFDGPIGYRESKEEMSGVVWCCRHVSVWVVVCYLHGGGETSTNDKIDGNCSNWAMEALRQFNSDYLSAKLLRNWYQWLKMVSFEW